MLSENKFKLSFPSKSINESFARMAVSAFCMQFDPTIEQINDIKTAVSEAVTNCVVHCIMDFKYHYIIHVAILLSYRHYKYTYYICKRQRRRYIGCKKGHGAYVYYRYSKRACRFGLCRYAGVYG